MLLVWIQRSILSISAFEYLPKRRLDKLKGRDRAQDAVRALPGSSWVDCRAVLGLQGGQPSRPEIRLGAHNIASWSRLRCV